MKSILFAIIILCSFETFSQITGNVLYDNGNYKMEGNSVYGNSNYNNSYQNTAINSKNNNNYLANDSVYMINSKVMINVQPDAYIVVFGIQQEALTVVVCNKLLNERLNKFKSALKISGINEEDIFIDLIAQTRIYDFKIIEKTATETKQGFELKKNIIIKITDHNLIDKMMILASEQEIYDIIKVEYILYDVEKIYKELEKSALEIIENKRKFALSNSSLNLSDKGLLYYENFSTVYPNEGYRQYEAKETASVKPSYYSGDTWVKEQRKSKTFYFEKLNPAFFDRVINPLTVKVPVQITLDLGFKYYIGKQELRTRK